MKEITLWQLRVFFKPSAVCSRNLLSPSECNMLLKHFYFHNGAYLSLSQLISVNLLCLVKGFVNVW